MSSEIAVKMPNEQIDLIRRTIAKGASKEELDFFLWQCQRTGLDPVARQVYLIERRERNKDGTYGKKMTPQVSIDGFRLIAERTKVYAGQLGPEWCGDDGKWRDVWLEKKPPSAARVGVLRRDFSQPLYAVARFDAYKSEYKGQLGGLWAKMPDVMIAKCAESLALRRAFPQELSGLYTSEEMQQADVVDADVRPADSPQPSTETPETQGETVDEAVEPKLSAKRADAMLRELGKLGYSENDTLELVAEVVRKGVVKLTELSEKEALEVWNAARKRPVYTETTKAPYEVWAGDEDAQKWASELGVFKSGHEVINEWTALKTKLESEKKASSMYRHWYVQVSSMPGLQPA